MNLEVLLVLFGCFTLSHGQTITIENDADNTIKRSLFDPSSIIEAQGWSVEFPARFNSKAIMSLPNTRSGRGCLEMCISSKSPGCRLVQYNVDTRACIGFKVNVEGTFRSTNSSISLLAISNKQFSSRNALHPNGNPITGADGVTVANNGVVNSEAQCLTLCHIHPRCKAIYAWLDTIVPPQPLPPPPAGFTPPSSFIDPYNAQCLMYPNSTSFGQPVFDNSGTTFVLPVANYISYRS